MPQFGIWRFALPLWDMPAVTGDAAPSSEPVETSTDESSLAEHEAAFGGAPKPAADASTATETARERDDKTGQFQKPRHRAASQQATADDVPRIRELTAKLRAAEGERDEWKRKAETPREAARETAPREEPKPAAKPRFPDYEEFIKIPGNENASWYDYDDAKEEWREAHRQASARARQAADTEARAIKSHLDSYSVKMAEFVKTHPDFDEVLSAAPKVSDAIERAVLEMGPEFSYYLATHDEELKALNDLTVGVEAKDPEFARVVALTRRHLSSLVASEQRPPSSRAAAGSTGAALALVAPTAPKPPTPVRSSAPRHEDAPSDDDSLADHERRYGPKQKRA